jgi:hypothetical protein
LSEIWLVSERSVALLRSRAIRSIRYFLQRFNGDGVPDIAVGIPFDDDGGTSRGSVWALYLNRDGTVRTYQKISDTQGNFAAGPPKLINPNLVQNFKAILNGAFFIFVV